MVNNILKEYYAKYDENDRLLRKRGQVEFLTTIKYIEKYLSKGMNILEIGAGTGRYSHFFAQQGYKVDAVELIESNIDVFKKNSKKDEDISVRQGNAVDLSFFNDNSFDITLLLGPMYHLFNEQDKLKALSEAIRVTRKGGIIFVAYCMNEASVISYGFLKGNILKAIDQGIIDTNTYKFASVPEEIFELYRKEDIDKLRMNFNVEQLHYVGTDMYTKYIQDEVENLDDEMFKRYLEFHNVICEKADMVGISHHTLDVFRKR